MTPQDAKDPRRELSLRIVSGVALAAAALALTWAGPVSFTALVLAGALVLTWEWARVTRGTSFDWTMLLHAAVAVAVTLLSAFGQPVIALIGLLIAAAVVIVAGLGSGGALQALGFLYVGLPALALVWLRADVTHGLAAVLYVFLVVWMTDTAAYASGRLLGGPKLAPSISPGKTWSGLIGGVAAAMTAAAVFSAFYPVGAPARLAALAGGLSIASQIGDLGESALKRRAGVKDASRLIPGHGGLLDRVDGLVLAAFCAALIGLVSNAAAPGRALLLGE